MLTPVPASPQSPPRAVLAFTPRGHPVLGPWRAALQRHRPVEGIWGADGADLRRLALGLAPPDPVPPRTLPLAPWGAPWRPAHGHWLRRRLPHASAVIFTRPDQSPLLPAFEDLPRFYYAIDDYSTYGRDWDAAERTVLAACEHTVAVSRALGDALQGRGARQLTVLPNAVPAAWRTEAPAASPGPLPEGLVLPRPLAGVLGRISSRLRLDWLLHAIEAEPRVHWLFVGDVEEAELTAADRPLLSRLRTHPRCTLLGFRPFESLRGFAAALDLAVLPYSDRSTNPRGSPVRLFVHLPHAAPLFATPGCLQVGEFQPLVTLCASPDELAAAIARRATAPTPDPHGEERWRLSAQHTWESRAADWARLLAG